MAPTLAQLEQELGGPRRSPRRPVAEPEVLEQFPTENPFETLLHAPEPWHVPEPEPEVLRLVLAEVRKIRLEGRPW
jgi:hypothetical protein